MSTKVHCKVEPNDWMGISKGRIVSDDPRIDIYVRDASGPRPWTAATEVSRAEFLAAVEKELDVIIINRNELPEMNDQRAQSVLDYYVGSGGLHALTARFLEMLATVEHLETTPPADEAAVDALAALIRKETTPPQDEPLEDLARRLYHAGVRVGGDDK